MGEHSAKLLALGAFIASAFANGDDGGCCKFTLSAPEIACPAGELSDGQIRLNGSEPISTFCISNGVVTDQNGYGCVVTAPPETQIQCDLNRPGMPGFAIGSDNSFTYNGSPNFFACPATDTEWNIYISPNFGQAKCMPITLKADGCGAAPPPPPPPPPPTTTAPTCAPSTITMWSTQWATVTGQMTTITSTYTETETETETDMLPCPTTPVTNTTTGCSKCTRKSTTTTPWNTTTAMGCTKCGGGTAAPSGSTGPMKKRVNLK